MQEKFCNLKDNSSLTTGGGKNRISGIDAIRALAMFNVIAGHWTSINTPFRQIVFDGSLSMILQGASGFFFYSSGVPLFIMMTGYLNTKKMVFDRKYMYGIARVLLAYIFFSIATFAFKGYMGMGTWSLAALITGTLDFSIIGYAWYIEMWIGLYLLTPFLNLGYNAIPNRQMKISLIVVLFILTAVPYFTNRYGQYLTPAFWMDIYPVLFFMVGRYIKEYKPIVKWWKLVAIVLPVCLINPLFSTFVVKDRPMMHIAGDSSGILGVVVAVCIFLFLYRADIKLIVLKWCVTKISLLSLDIYLCCYMVDRMVYPYFIDRYYESQQQFGKWFFVIVPLVLLISAIIAQLKEWLFAVLRLNKL